MSAIRPGSIQSAPRLGRRFESVRLLHFSEQNHILHFRRAWYPGTQAGDTAGQDLARRRGRGARACSGSYGIGVIHETSGRHPQMPMRNGMIRRRPCLAGSPVFPPQSSPNCRPSEGKFNVRLTAPAPGRAAPQQARAIANAHCLHYAIGYKRPCRWHMPIPIGSTDGKHKFT